MDLHLRDVFGSLVDHLLPYFSRLFVKQILVRPERCQQLSGILRAATRQVPSILSWTRLSPDSLDRLIVLP